MSDQSTVMEPLSQGAPQPAAARAVAARAGAKGLMVSSGESGQPIGQPGGGRPPSSNRRATSNYLHFPALRLARAGPWRHGRGGAAHRIRQAGRQDRLARAFMLETLTLFA